MMDGMGMGWGLWEGLGFGWRRRFQGWKTKVQAGKAGNRQRKGATESVHGGFWGLFQSVHTRSAGWRGFTGVRFWFFSVLQWSSQRHSGLFSGHEDWLASWGLGDFGGPGWCQVPLKAPLGSVDGGT